MKIKPGKKRTSVNQEREVEKQEQELEETVEEWLESGQVEIRKSGA